MTAVSGVPSGVPSSGEHQQGTPYVPRRLSENYDSQSFGPGGGMSILIQTSHRLRRDDTKPPFSGSGPFKNAISSLLQCPLVGLARMLHAPIAPNLEQIMG